MSVCVWGGGGVGAGGGELKLVYAIPTLALSFHSSKNIYLFGPCGGLITHPLIIRATNKSQTKPIMKLN